MRRESPWAGRSPRSETRRRWNGRFRRRSLRQPRRVPAGPRPRASWRPVPESRQGRWRADRRHRCEAAPSRPPVARPLRRGPAGFRLRACGSRPLRQLRGPRERRPRGSSRPRAAPRSDQRAARPPPPGEHGRRRLRGAPRPPRAPAPLRFQARARHVPRLPPARAQAPRRASDSLRFGRVRALSPACVRPPIAHAPTRW